MSRRKYPALSVRPGVLRSRGRWSAWKRSLALGNRSETDLAPVAATGSPSLSTRTADWTISERWTNSKTVSESCFNSPPAARQQFLEDRVGDRRSDLRAEDLRRFLHQLPGRLLEHVVDQKEESEDDQSIREDEEENRSE